MTTITWNVSQLDCYPQESGHTDVVFNVHWQCNGVDGDYNAQVYSTCAVTISPDTPFTPYENLTQDQVLGWIWASGVDQTATEDSVKQQIESKKYPPVITPPLPWA